MLQYANIPTVRVQCSTIYCSTIVPQNYSNWYVSCLHDLTVQLKSNCVKFQVHENGTVAAAATGIGFTFKSMSLSFLPNKPFYFVIRYEDTKSVLFMGSIVSPV